MNILAFDTCFAACSAAAAKNYEPGAEHAAGLRARFEAMATGHAERLPSMIREVMADAGLDFPDLDRIAITNGPGSFTGTRISVAAARALSLSTSCDLVAVSSLAVMAEQARGKLATETCEARNTGMAGAPLLIVVDARRGEVYVQRFDTGGSDAVTGPLLLPIADATALAGPGRTLVAGSGAAAVAGAAGKAGKQVTAHLPDLLPDARDLCRLATTMDPTRGAIKPLYLRPANAKPQSGKSIERATP